MKCGHLGPRIPLVQHERPSCELDAPHIGDHVARVGWERDKLRWTSDEVPRPHFRLHVRKNTRTSWVPFEWQVEGPNGSTNWYHLCVWAIGVAVRDCCA